MAGRLIRGEVTTPLPDLGWASVGVLELTALPSIKQEVWAPTVRAADALLFWGGDPVYLSHWMRESGLADLLPSLGDTVYVGTSAGAMVAASVFGETYTEPRAGSGSPLTSEDMVFATPQGDVSRIFVTAEGTGLVDFAVIPHLDNEDHPDASLANAERWTTKLPVPTYAIDDATALTVTDGVVEVISEGHWELSSRPADAGSGGTALKIEDRTMLVDLPHPAERPTGGRASLPLQQRGDRRAGFRVTCRR